MVSAHQPVLLQECVDCFKECHLTYFVDGTLGAGGHAEAILKAHPEIKMYIAFDQDLSAIEIAKKRLFPFHDKLHIIHRNFRHLDEELKQIQDTIKDLKIDGMLFDLGVSSMQLDQAERGFSFSKEGPLDMRMDVTKSLTAECIVNEWSEAEIARILRDYGEVKQWRYAARKIVQTRAQIRLRTTKDLASLFPKSDRKGPGNKIHPATLIFQALRIAVNQELEVLETLLKDSIAWLSSKGRLGVISFHSLEDRLVKQAFRFLASDKWDTSSSIGGVFLDKVPEVKLVTRKPIGPTIDESAENPRARSAKLRIVEKFEA